MYLRNSGPPSSALSSVSFLVIIRDAGTRDTPSVAEREDLDLRSALGDGGVVSGRDGGSERASSRS